jgi:hypothetical protein
VKKSGVEGVVEERYENVSGVKEETTEKRFQKLMLQEEVDFDVDLDYMVIVPPPPPSPSSPPPLSLSLRSFPLLPPLRPIESLAQAKNENQLRNQHHQKLLRLARIERIRTQWECDKANGDLKRSRDSHPPCSRRHMIELETKAEQMQERLSRLKTAVEMYEWNTKHPGELALMDIMNATRTAKTGAEEASNTARNSCEKVAPVFFTFTNQSAMDSICKRGSIYHAQQAHKMYVNARANYEWHRVGDKGSPVSLGRGGEEKICC